MSKKDLLELEELEKEFEQILKGEIKLTPPKKIYKETYAEYLNRINKEAEEEQKKELKRIQKKELKKQHQINIKLGLVNPAYETQIIYNWDNKDNYNWLVHKIQITKMIREHPNKIYKHQVLFFDEKNKLIDKIISMDEDNPYYDDTFGESIDCKNKEWKFKKFTKSIFNSITFKMAIAGSSLYWIPKVLFGNNKNYYTMIKTSCYDKINYNKRDDKQIYKDNEDGTCFYDGIIKFFNEKYEKNKDKTVKAIINKLTKNEEIYKKSYTQEEIEKFCIEFKISVCIRDFIGGNDIIINQSKFNKYNIEFINTKYNHLDVLINSYDVEELNNNQYNYLKDNINFYIEMYGKLITIDKTYIKKKDDFKLTFNKWAEDVNLNKLYINQDSQEYEMLNNYDYNVHRFFNKYSGNESDYIEYDLKSAYYNYSNKNFNKHYLGLPSGSFINFSCCSKFTIETVREQANNKIVGYYQLRIKKIKKNNYNLELLGFSVDTVHVLYTPTILLLSDYLEFDFLNASISPSVDIPFNKDFLKDFYESDKEDNKKKSIKYYCKAVGILFIENTDINIEVKPRKKDKEFYKTFYNKNYEVYEIDDGIYNICINNKNKKSLLHLAFGIHAYTTTQILEVLLNIDISQVLGVKLDSIVINKDYNYNFDNNIFKQKKSKLEKMINLFITNEDFNNFTNEDKKIHTALLSNDYIYYTTYKHECYEILKFNKIFTPDGSYIVKRVIFFGGIGGSGKTHTILNSSIPNKNICFTSRSWNLVEKKQAQHPEIIGLSIPKIIGYCENKKVEKINNNNIKFIVQDEMTMSQEEETENIINLYDNCFIFLLGDISKDGFSYQCTIYKNIYKPNNQTQYIEFIKTYRFDKELNDRLLLLRKNQYNNKDELNNIGIHKKYFKELFKDRIFKPEEINFLDNDVGISTHNDYKKENFLTEYFIKKGAKPQYYIKNTILSKNQLRGQKIEEKPEHNNFEEKLFKTIHSFQGDELTQHNNIIIFLGAIFDYNLLYTAVSRARRTSQIYIFETI